MIRTNFSTLGFPCILLILLSSFVHAGRITGVVTNSQSGKPLPGTMVEIEGAGRTVYCDSLGQYEIDSVEAGSWNLIFYNEFSEPLNRNDIYVPGDGTVHADAELTPRVYALDKMVVRANAFVKAPDMAASSKVMNFDEILRSPGALVDVQRAVQDLPSVASGGDNTNEIVVRGGTPGENLMLMDNIEIPNPNHFAEEGSGGGVVSLINPLLVKGLTFSAGAPPAQYGGKASSVLDVKLREGNDKIVLGGVDLGMAGMGFHAEGPLWTGSTFMASGTKSFLDFVARYANETAVPEYWGLQTKLTQRFGSQKIYGNLIYGSNHILIGNARTDVGTDGDAISAGGLIYASGISWEGYWGDRLSSIITISGIGNSFDRFEYSSRMQGDSTVYDSFFVNNSIEQEQSIKLQGSLDIPNNGKLQAGGEIRRCDFNIDIWEHPDTLTEYTYSGDSITGSKVVTDSSGNPVVYRKDAQSSEIAYKYNGFISCIAYPFEKLRVVPGIRCDAFTYNSSFTVSPRVGTVYSLTPSLDLTGAFGVQYQEPDYADLTASPVNRNLKPQRAVTGIIGSEFLVSQITTKFIAEAFYKKYNNLEVDSGIMTADPLDKSDVLFSLGEGRSYGVELFIHKKLTRHVSGSIGYSLSKSELLDLRPGNEGKWYAGDYDFGSALTITGGYKTELLGYTWYKRLHDRWWFAALSPVMPIADRLEFSAKWRFLGGRPKTEPEFNPLYRRWVINQNNLNNSRYPDYHKLDLRFERRFGFGFLQMIYYFDLQNIYNKDNIWTYMYSDKYGTQTPIYQFHFFPAGGVIIGF